MSWKRSIRVVIARSFIALVVGSQIFPVAVGADAPHIFDLFNGMARQPNDLATLGYLKGIVPRLESGERNAGMQLLATADSLVGNYGLANREFPLGVPPKGKLPQGDGWEATDAAEYIVEHASEHHIVMINEAHHDATTRTLTLGILKAMKARGYDFLAVEALPEGDEIQQRGYPVRTRGGLNYLDEPVYAELLRQAVALGFTLVPYDYGFKPDAGIPDREIAEAQNIVKQVFATHPHAKLLVHAGWNHIDHALPERLATQLEKLTGTRAFTIDQTSLRDHPGQTYPLYDTLLARYHPAGPVIIHRKMEPYSANPASYDVTVLSPRLLAGDGRGDWLRLHGERWPEEVSIELCGNAVPCMIEARRIGEDPAAVPADRVVLDNNAKKSRLYLYPGTYQVDAQGIEGARRAVSIWIVGSNGSFKRCQQPCT